MAANGRIPTDSGNAKAFDLFAESPRLNLQGRPHIYNHDMIKDTAANDLSIIFFSNMNIDALQNEIIGQVHEQSGGTASIARQSDQELKIVMRGLYYQNASFTPYRVLEQVRALNKSVLDFCVPTIVKELAMHKYYLNDINRLPVPMERGGFISSKGSKVLEMKLF